MSKRAEEIDFEQAVYKAFGQVKDYTLAMRIAEYFYKQAEKDLGWHSVKDSLPKIGDSVMTCEEMSGISTCLALGVLDENGWHDDKGEALTPSHWMPIPDNVD